MHEYTPSHVHPMCSQCRRMYVGPPAPGLTNGCLALFVVYNAVGTVNRVKAVSGGHVWMSCEAVGRLGSASFALLVDSSYPCSV